MKTEFYYKPRFVTNPKENGGGEREVTGEEAVALGKVEQEAWRTVILNEDIDHPLWHVSAAWWAVMMVVFSWTREAKRVLIEDLLTRDRYVVPITPGLILSPKRVAELGPRWMSTFVKSRGTWCHQHERYESAEEQCNAG